MPWQCYVSWFRQQKSFTCFTKYSFSTLQLKYQGLLVFYVSDSMTNLSESSFVQSEHIYTYTLLDNSWKLWVVNNLSFLSLIMMITFTYLFFDGKFNIYTVAYSLFSLDLSDQRRSISTHYWTIPGNCEWSIIFLFFLWSWW